MKTTFEKIDEWIVATITDDEISKPAGKSIFKAEGFNSFGYSKCKNTGCRIKWHFGYEPISGMGSSCTSNELKELMRLLGIAESVIITFPDDNGEFQATVVQ